MNIEKQIEFLLENQANHDSKISKLIDAQAKNEVLMASVLQGISEIKESILGLARIAQAHQGRIEELEGGRA